MNNFPLPPQGSSPSTPAIPTGLPPKHKIKSEPPQNNSNDTNQAADPEAELQQMLNEEYPPIVDKPPQCDWHLGAILSGGYPDPFSLPALQFAQQSLIHDMAALMHAINESAKDTAATDSDSKDAAAK